MERQFDIDNKRERERLRSLVSRITDEELDLPYYEEGWTIATGLAPDIASAACTTAAILASGMSCVGGAREASRFTHTRTRTQLTMRS